MKYQQTLTAILEEMSQKGRAFTYTKGRSMLPMLKEGRDISVLIPPGDNLRVGEVVLFVRPNCGNELVLHRIVKVVSPDSFLIRGDNVFYDEPVTRKNIIAVLEGFFRKGKYINCKESKPYSLYSFLMIHLYFLRKFFCNTLKLTGVKIKNNVFHLHNLHLNSLFKRK